MKEDEIMNKNEAGLKIQHEIEDYGLSHILSKAQAMVAGGAFLSLMENREVNDIDVFFPSKDAVEEALAEAKTIPGFKSEYNNSTACMFTIEDSMKFNFVKKRFFSTLDELFDDFDFTCTMIGFHCNDFIIKSHIGFDDAFEEKKLVFNHLNHYPLTSLPRVLRYQNRGYTISCDEIKLMGMAIADIEITTGEEFVHHVGGLYSDNPDDTEVVFGTLRKTMDSYRERNPY